MRTIYIDAVNSGISGDMFLASLLDLVPNSDMILKILKELKNYLPGVLKLEIDLVKINRSGILINKLNIKIKEKKNHRSTKILKAALNRFLEEKNYSNSAKDYAKRVLNSLLLAEAEVHGVLADDIHLHELSSVDTLLDILGVAKALDILGCFESDFKVNCSKLPLGGGTIKVAHGVLPVPAPATSKILERSNLIVFEGPIEDELVTPTGAALLANLNPTVLPYEMNLRKLVYSTGQKEFNNFLNILRIFYGETKEKEFSDSFQILKKYIEPVTVLETDVDDVSGEILGNFIKNFESENILDIQITPNITKKNRPSYTIRVLCHPEEKFGIIEKILDELGTLGVRISALDRVCVDRKIENKKIEIDNKTYDIRYKVSFIETENEIKIVNIKPEYDDLKKISLDSGFTVKRVLFFAQAQINNVFNKDKILKK